MGITEKLMRIQTEIKAPKNLYNRFGDFKYRNAESICEAVKPYLIREKMTLTLSDDIVDVGGRIYVKATAELRDIESEDIYTVSAYARESETKKGMDDSQITGTSSSYARKYALNGLFLLDDTKDADSDEYHNQTDKMKTQRENSTKKFVPATSEQIRKMDEFVTSYAELCENATEKDIWKRLKQDYKFEHVSDLSTDLAEKIIKLVEGWYKKMKGNI